MGVSENRGSRYSTLNSRILIIRTPKIRYPSRKLPYRGLGLGQDCPAVREYIGYIWEFPGAPFFGVLIIRILLFKVLY